MSTTTELVAAKQAHQQLRNRIEALADQMECDARDLLKIGGGATLSYANCSLIDAKSVRALLEDA